MARIDEFYSELYDNGHDMQITSMPYTNVPRVGLQHTTLRYIRGLQESPESWVDPE